MSVLARDSFGGNLHLISSIFHCPNSVSILLNGQKLSLIHRIKWEMFLLFWVGLSRYILCIICLYFFSKGMLGLTITRTGKQTAAKPGKHIIFFYQTFRTSQLGPQERIKVKNGRGVHPQLGAQQLEQSQVYGPFQNRNFCTSNGTLLVNFSLKNLRTYF